MSLDLAATALAEPKANTGFGATGWRMIIFSIFMYFAYAGWCADGINIFSPALAAKNGWEVGKLLTLVAPGGLMGVVGAGFFGQVQGLGGRQLAAREQEALAFTQLEAFAKRRAGQLSGA